MKALTDVARSLALGAGTHDFVGVVARAHDAQPDLALLLDAHLQREGRVRQTALGDAHATQRSARAISSVET